MLGKMWRKDNPPKKGYYICLTEGGKMHLCEYNLGWRTKHRVFGWFDTKEAPADMKIRDIPIPEEVFERE